MPRAKTCDLILNMRPGTSGGTHAGGGGWWKLRYAPRTLETTSTHENKPMIKTYGMQCPQPFVDRLQLWAHSPMSLGHSAMFRQAPRCEDGLVIADVAVPKVAMELVTNSGAFKDFKMVELSRIAGGTPLYLWCFKPMGFTWKQVRNGEPWKLPFFGELRQAMHPPTLKRKRDGKGYDENGNLRPEHLVITVRGKTMDAYNSKRHLLVGLNTKEDINWLLLELWSDLNKADVPGGVPGINNEATPRCQMPTAFMDVLEPILSQVRQLDRCASASWDHKYGRVRVFAIKSKNERQHKPRYLQIKGYRRLVSRYMKEEEADAALEDWHDAVVPIVESARHELEAPEEHT